MTITKLSVEWVYGAITLTRVARNEATAVTYVMDVTALALLKTIDGGDRRDRSDGSSYI